MKDRVLFSKMNEPTYDELVNEAIRFQEMASIQDYYTNTYLKEVRNIQPIYENIDEIVENISELLVSLATLSKSLKEIKIVCESLHTEEIIKELDCKEKFGA